MIWKKQGPEREPEIYKDDEGNIQSCYKETWRGIQENVTKGELDLKIFRNTGGNNSCIKYFIYLYEYAKESNSEPTFYKLIHGDLKEVKSTEKNRPSRKYLSKIEHYFERMNEVCNDNDKNSARVNLGIQICEKLQQAFKSAASVSTKGSFLSQKPVKDYMKEQSRILKLSIAKIKKVRATESKNPIKKILSKLGPSRKKLDAKEAKYFVQSIENKKALFKEFPDSDEYISVRSFYDACCNIAGEIAKRLNPILNNKINSKSGTSEGKYLKGIQEACIGLINLQEQLPKKKNDDIKPSDLTEQLAALQTAFFKVYNNTKHIELKYLPLLADKKVKNYMYSQARILGDLVIGFDKSIEKLKKLEESKKK